MLSHLECKLHFCLADSQVPDVAVIINLEIFAIQVIA
jgi:hypothetical protein